MIEEGEVYYTDLSRCSVFPPSRSLSSSYSLNIITGKSSQIFASLLSPPEKFHGPLSFSSGRYVADNPSKSQVVM